MERPTARLLFDAREFCVAIPVGASLNSNLFVASCRSKPIAAFNGFSKLLASQSRVVANIRQEEIKLRPSARSNPTSFVLIVTRAFVKKNKLVIIAL